MISMVVWDTITHNDHPCVVEQEWTDPDTQHHMLALRPRDVDGGLFIVDEEELNGRAGGRNDPRPETETPLVSARE